MGEFAEKATKIYLGIMAMRPDQGALTQLYLATSPDVEEKDIRGKYYMPIANPIEPTAISKDEALQDKLWTFSENLVREKVKV
ncbi:hypothetical protein BGX29_012138 [Mortierella sp. GBA35]|nr:hypothetical protein BGX29_012138 [Mortierella sp. GBA35]